MVQRNRGDADEVLARVNKRITPDPALLHIRKHIAVAEHGPFRQARGTAGVLQKSKIIRFQSHGLEAGFSALLQGRKKTHAAR